MWGRGLRGQKRCQNCMAYPLFPVGSAREPHPPSGRGGGGVVGTDPSHSLSLYRCPTHPPWGIGIRLVRKGSVTSAAGPPAYFLLRSFLFARGIPVPGGIHEWLALPPRHSADALVPNSLFLKFLFKLTMLSALVFELNKALFILSLS